MRELSNAIHRAYIMTDGEWITQIGLSQEPTLSADFSGRSFQVGVGDRIDAVEKRLILATVQHTHTKEAAAEILGVSVKTLYNRLRAYESGADLPRPPARRRMPRGAAMPAVRRRSPAATRSAHARDVNDRIDQHVEVDRLSRRPRRSPHA